MTQTARSAIALRRTADALFRGSAARSVMLRIPAARDPRRSSRAARPGDAAVSGYPAITGRSFETLPHKLAEGKARAAISSSLRAPWKRSPARREFASADALFASAFGVLVDDALLTITAATELEAGGAVYAYRLALREAIRNAHKRGRIICYGRGYMYMQRAKDTFYIAMRDRIASLESRTYRTAAGRPQARCAGGGKRACRGVSTGKCVSTSVDCSVSRIPPVRCHW